MDLENQARILALSGELGPENVVVLLGGAEPESAGIAAETVTMGDPAYAGPLTEVPLGLAVYHIMEPVLKEEIDPAVYEEQLGMMEMVLDIENLTAEVSAMREQGSKY